MGFSTIGTILVLSLQVARCSSNVFKQWGDVIYETTESHLLLKILEQNGTTKEIQGDLVSLLLLKVRESDDE